MSYQVSDNEEWKGIEGFADYQISNHGQVKRITLGLRQRKCGLIKPWLNNKGYKIIGLAKDKKNYRFPVHRLVCFAFHGHPPSSKHEVAHYDGNPLNNHASNLRWATRSENMEDARRHGTMAIGPRHGSVLSPHRQARGEKHGRSKLTQEQVLDIRSRERSPGSGRRLAEAFGVSPALICLIRKGEIWKESNKHIEEQT